MNAAPKEVIRMRVLEIQARQVLDRTVANGATGPRTWAAVLRLERWLRGVPVPLAAVRLDIQWLAGRLTARSY